MLLSANFLELRSNHFHSGIDVKVGGVVGAKLFAIDEGYISRVRVCAGGYGKCVYIMHPNGYTSVYAHMDSFSKPIRELVEKIQYESQLFEVDTTLHEGFIRIKKGESIGTAGNSGYSFGPHLHFEIRDENEVPLNPVHFYSFTDNLAPELHKLSVYTVDSVRNVPHSRLTHQVDLKGVKGTARVDSIVHIESPAYIALEAIDRMTGTHNKFGIRTMRVELDGKAIFSIKVDSISFDISRYINSLIAYDERQNSGKALIKSYVEPGNVLPIVKEVWQNGLISLPDDKVHKLAISVTDDKGNASTLNLKVQESKKKQLPTSDNGGKLVRWDTVASFTTPELALVIPDRALYNDILLDVKKVDTTSKYLSPTYKIHTPQIPLHKPIEAAIKANIPDSLQAKALVAFYRENPKNPVNIGGNYHNGFMTFSSGSFGYFFVTVDTIPPTITPNFKKGANLRTHSCVSVKVKDNLSGIKSYNGYVDDVWVLFEYDAKNDKLVYYFDKTRTKQGKKHKLRLDITDSKDNVAHFESDFTW